MDGFPKSYINTKGIFLSNIMKIIWNKLEPEKENDEDGGNEDDENKMMILNEKLNP